MSNRLFWGDLHSHCSISYGEGTVAQALARARDQLDFCSITGHAFWPDMPQDRDRYAGIIDYHREGFARLATNWDQLIDEQRDASQPGRFLALPSYEWHSLEYGDHNVYAAGPGLALTDAPNLAALREVARAARGIMIPHHIGYAAGYRGLDWQHFDAALSPFVEIYSLHGCSESEDAPYPMLHDMGPRDWNSTATAGWAAGHRFGVIASSDHHGGYPGSHGDGRVGVWARELTREAIWEAFLARRVYAVTGDKIQARLRVDGAEMGAEVRSNRPQITVDVQGSDAVDYVELLKNDLVWKRFYPHRRTATELEPQSRRRYRLRVTWGWGQKDRRTPWSFELRLSDGRIVSVETCFSGQAIVAPQGVGGHETGADTDDLPHAVVEQQARQLNWRSMTAGNPSMRHDTTQAVSLELEAKLSDQVTLAVNGLTVRRSLGELLRRGQVHYLRGWLSEAVRIGPLVPLDDCCVFGELVDDTPDRPQTGLAHASSAPALQAVESGNHHADPLTGANRYRIRVRQFNGQWAWTSPVWVGS